ncbi:MAG: RNA polymerase sigma factor, partial [Planctomycetota bacterium]
MSDPDPLKELLRRAGTGDNDAAGQIARRYEGELRRYVSRRLGDKLRSRVDTEDLLQSTFFVAMKHLNGLQYEDEGSFKAWLRAVAENKIRMAARFHGAARRDHRMDHPLGELGEPAGERTTPS